MGREKTVSIITLVIAAVLIVTGCSQDIGTPATASLSVQVSDASDAKTISPSGNVNISHYDITVMNSEGRKYSSGLITKGSVFVVSGVETGLWKASVSAYAQNAGGQNGYVLVAQKESDSYVEVKAGEEAVINITLDTLVDAPSGDVTVTMMLPSDFTVGQTVYAVWSLDGENSYSLSWNNALALTVGDGNTATFTLDADNLLGGGEQLMQGVWTVTVEVADAKDEASQSMVRKGVEIMRLLAGLPASGVINLSSQSMIDDGLEITITDQTGDLLQLGSAAISSDGEGITVNVGYNGIPLSTPASIYIDGDKISTDGEISYSETDITGGKTFVINGLSAGEHVIMISVNNGSFLGTGSVTFKVKMESQEISGDVITEDYVHFTSENMSSEGSAYRYKEIDGLYEWAYPKAGSATSPKGRMDGYIRFSTGEEWKYVGSVFMPASDNPDQILGQLIFTESWRNGRTGCHLLCT